MDTVRESVLKVYSGDLGRSRTRVSIGPGFPAGRSANWLFLYLCDVRPRCIPGCCFCCLSSLRKTVSRNYVGLSEAS